MTHPSPNFGSRRDGLTPQFVVLHYTAMADADSAARVLCDPASEVSAHYLICKSGELWQLVKERDRAWHAGAGEWCGLTDMNSRSIGIELDNDGASPFCFALMDSLEELLTDILSRWSIPPENVIGHSDMAPGRKIDPGPWFDWARLEASGLAGLRASRPVSEPNMRVFRQWAHAAGYTSLVDNDTLLKTVRLRYRSFATGKLCAQDLAPLRPTTIAT